MVRRKLVKQGTSTYTVSLPKDWVERLSVKPGEEIDLEEHATKLIISSIKENKQNEKRNFLMKEIPPELSHEFVVALYKAGFNDISLKNCSDKQIKDIKKILGATLGLEVISLDKERVDLLDLGTSTEESLLKAENQIYWRLLYMVERLSDKNSSLEEIKEIDYEINKLAFYIERNISQKFSSSPRNFLFYEKVSLLEKIGDFLRSLKTYSKDLSKLDKVLKKIEAIIELFRKHPKDMQEFLELSNLLYSLKKDVDSFQKSTKNPFTLAIILIYKTLKELFDVCFTLSIENFSSTEEK